MLGKILRWLLIIVVGFLGIGLLLPGTSHVERQIDIASPAPLVYDQVNELKNWVNWSPWAKLDPNVKWVYSEPSSAGLGAYYTWVGNDKVGEGKLTIIDAKPTELLKTKMEFKGQGDAMADFKFTAKDSTATKVVWSFDSDHGMNPFARWFGLAMNSFIGPDYEKGLANLKAHCESKK
ncbi:MAG: SRPBCC family protein [Saprospiraceae bacterium]|nr:SRPBCC family protein [Saprospiraceae bacterium]